MIALLRIGKRYIQKHQLQSFLLVLGIALGVAVVVAIDLTNQSSQKSFRLATQTVTGRATHQIVFPPLGVPEKIYHKLRVELGIQQIAPVVEGYVGVAELGGRPLKLLGLDPFVEAPFRSYATNSQETFPQEVFNPFLTQPNTVLISQDVAHKSNLKVNDILTLEYGSKVFQVKLIGFLNPGDDISREALSGIIITDIATAQELLDKIHYLSHIDLIIDDPDTLQKITSVLPPGVRVETAQQRSASVERMSQSFETNLSALSFLALIMGMFLVYNTVSFSIVQRRPLLGVLRALGTTRNELFTMILLETALLTIAGITLGIFLGIILGKSLVHLVTQTINDFYFTVVVTDISVSVVSIYKGIISGVIAALLATIKPAYEATNVPPASVMKRSKLESGIVEQIPMLSIAGIIFLGISMILAFIPSESIALSFMALCFVILGVTFLVPIFAFALMKLLSPVFRKVLGICGELAARNIMRSLSRTAITIATLMVAVAVIIGVSIMISSFRDTVENWLKVTLQANVFVTPPPRSAGQPRTFPSEIVQEIATFPAVEKIMSARVLKLDTAKYGQVVLRAVSEDISLKQRFVWLDESKPRNQWLDEGAVFISEPFAYHHKFSQTTGQCVELSTRLGIQKFPVVGIYRDYESEKGTIIMSSRIYRKIWQDQYLSTLSIIVKPGENIEKLVSELRQNFAGRHQLLILSHSSLLKSALSVFDRTFAVTEALRLLAIIIAFIGVLSTLLSLQLERVREVGVLRALGMTRRQVSFAVTIETTLMGFIAGILAIPVGIVLSLILIHVVNPRSFGWTLEFLPRPEHFYQGFLLAIFAALLAGIYPAIQFARISPVNALRTE